MRLSKRLFCIVDLGLTCVLSSKVAWHSVSLCLTWPCHVLQTTGRGWSHFFAECVSESHDLTYDTMCLHPVTKLCLCLQTAGRGGDHFGWSWELHRGQQVYVAGGYWPQWIAVVPVLPVLHWVWMGPPVHLRRRLCLLSTPCSIQVISHTHSSLHSSQRSGK